MRLHKIIYCLFLLIPTYSFAAEEVTVIFESGFGIDGEVWNPVIKQLPDNIKVINPTRLSLTSANTQPTTIQQDVSSLIKKIHSESEQRQVIVVGHSYGGLIVTEAIREASSQVLGVVLIEPTVKVQRVRYRKLDSERVARDDKVMAKYMPSHLLPHYKLLMQELDSTDETLIPLPADLRVTLYTSTQLHPEPMFIEETKAGKELWMQMHNELFSLIRVGQHIRSDKWGHSIHSQYPAEIANAILNLAAEGP